jgi:predicted NBD/HSP70 family sugar kinase
MTIHKYETVGRNQQYLKLINRAVVYRTIREAGKISRAELANRTGLNPATLTHITRTLLDQELIEEAGYSDSRGGRRRSLLQICADHGYIVAIRLARNNIQGMLTDLEMHNVTRQTVQSSTFLSHPLEITMPTMLGLIQHLIADSGLHRSQILGIGISAPGPLDARRGRLIAPPNFPGWPSTPIREIVGRETGLPVFLDNDANAAALAEKWFGIAREYENFVFLLVDEGVGGGVVIAGDIFRGEHDVAGEIGHTSIDFNGPRCDCGNTGCLELFTEPGVAVKYAQRQLSTGIPSVMHQDIHLPDDLDFSHLVKAAFQDDQLALEAIDQIIQPLAVGIVNIINTFDPEAVIIGGRLSQLGDILLQRLEPRVIERAMSHGAAAVKILVSILGYEAPTIGAFSLVLRELFQNPDFHPIKFPGDVPLYGKEAISNRL